MMKIHGGEYKERMEKVEKEATIHNEKPFALSFYPSGDKEKPLPGVIIEGEGIELTAFKKAENEESYMIRLYESRGVENKIMLRIPFWHIEEMIQFTPYEIKIYKVEVSKQKISEVGMMEITL